MPLAKLSHVFQSRRMPVNCLPIVLAAALGACVDDPGDAGTAALDEPLVSNPTLLVLNDQATVFNIATGAERDFAVGSVPGDGRMLNVVLQPTAGDVDLYVGWDTNLSRSYFHCASVAGGTLTDRCVITAPNDGVQRTLYVKAYGYVAGRSWLRVQSAPSNGSVGVNGSARTYQLPGDGQWYYLDVIVPGTIRRAAIYATPLSGNNLSMWINNCSSDRPNQGVERCEFSGAGITQVFRAYFRSDTGVIFNVQLDGTDRLFGFPLHNQTPRTTAINSVVDHQMIAWYAKDSSVVDAWGEKGQATYGNWSDCYKQASGANFTVNGNYTGAGHPANLCYDGHPGLDLRAGAGTDILSSCDGTVRYPSSDAVNGDPARFRTVYIDCGSGWTVWVLHASWTVAKDTAVSTGDVVARVGDTGAPGQPHLHIEIRRHGIPVDPYGWQGSTPDPMWIVPAVGLWQ